MKTLYLRSPLFKAFILILLCNSLFANERKVDFQINFNIAKQHLSQRRILEALPYLQYLNQQFPKNANLKYLIGLCYAEEEIVNPLTIQLLEESSEKSSMDYDPNSIKEERVPIYVYYYLTIAYAQNAMCKEAKEARDKFVEVYPHKDKFYLTESKKWIDGCLKMKRPPKADSIPNFPDFKPFVEVVEMSINGANFEKDTEEVEPNKAAIFPKHVVTKEIDYSTKRPLYGVQLGAYKEIIPVRRFADLKNVDAFMDNDGLLRYVVGHFGIYSQAESLLEAIKNKGYPDAFIVNVNNARKFSDEVVSVENINLRAALNSKVIFTIQLGAFRENISQNTAAMYLRIDGIKELKVSDLTLLTVGKFTNYLEAKAYLQGIKYMGMNDAFVIALNNGKKISLEQAKQMSNEN